MKLFLSFAFSAIVFLSFCQTKPNEFVVTTKGDTIRGTITIESKRFKSIKFMDAAGQDHLYSSSDISSFYDNEWGHYSSFKVILDISKSNQTQNLYSEPIVAFLETVIEAKGIAIYYFRNSEYGSHYFIRKGNNQPEELVLHEKTMPVNGQLAILKDEIYKRTLANYMIDCSGIQQKIDHCILSHKSLQDLVINYTSCSPSGLLNNSVIDKSTIDNGAWSWGILFGVNSSSFKYSNVNGVSETYSSSTGVILGAAANYAISKKDKSSALVNELLFKSISTSASNSYYYGNQDFSYSISYLRLNTLFRYNFVSKSTTVPFLLAGISNSFALSSSGQTTSSGTTTALDVKTYEQGLIFGGGVKIDKVDLFARIEFSNGLIPSNNTDKLSSQSFAFGLTYWITK